MHIVLQCPFFNLSAGCKEHITWVGEPKPQVQGIAHGLSALVWRQNVEGRPCGEWGPNYFPHGAAKAKGCPRFCGWGSQVVPEAQGGGDGPPALWQRPQFGQAPD